MIDLTNMKLGKKPAVHDKRTMRLSPILKTLKPAPDNLNWVNGVEWPMWKNDTYGCCTQVSVASALRTWTYIENKELLLTDGNVLNNYANESGWNPNIPSSDQGAVEVDVLRKWIKDGYQTPNGIDKLINFGYINPRNQDVVKQTIYLMGGLYIGASLPQYCLETTENVWNIETSNTEIAGGHAMFIHGYDSEYLHLNTWGQQWKMSWAFFFKYVDEAYGLLSEKWLNANKTSPLGESLDILNQELNQLS